MDGIDIFSLSWVLASCAVFFAAFVRGVAGFGLALILAPVLLLILDPKPVVVVNLFLGVVSNGLLLRYAFRNIDLRRILPMSACSLLGIPLGALIIKVIAPSTLKVLIGGLTVFFAVFIVIGFTAAFRRERLASGASGFLSGILSTATSLGGPPVVLFMHNQNWSKEVTHSSLAVYFFFICCCSLIALFISGLIDAKAIISAASLVPALLVGLALGMAAFFKVNAEFFRRLSIAIVIVTGILGILSGLEVFP